MPTPRLLYLLGLAACLPAFAATHGFHLWYDESGQAVYSQFGPGDGRQSETVKPPPPPAESAAEARERLQRRLQQFDDNREDQALAREAAGKTQTEAEQRRERCLAARKNLEVLNGPPRQLYRTSDGTVKRLSEEERQRQRAEMEKIVASDCAP